MSLTQILKPIRKELKAKNIYREKMLANSRRIIQYSKEAIFLIHGNRLAKAQKRLEAAKALYQSTQNLLKSTPELLYSGALFNSSQEYAEATILYTLETAEAYPTPEQVGIPTDSYILGLADIVGELRRKALESIKNGDAEKAEWSFNNMEKIYNELTLLNEHAFSVIPGLRRKSDVARHLVELTGGEVIMEKKRKRLEEYLRQIERKESKPKKQ